MFGSWPLTRARKRRGRHTVSNLLAEDEVLEQGRAPHARLQAVLLLDLSADVVRHVPFAVVDGELVQEVVTALLGTHAEGTGRERAALGRREADQAQEGGGRGE